MELNITEELFGKGKEFDNDSINDFLQLMMWYECALVEMETKLKVLDKEFNIIRKRNPIHSIQTRIKRPISIIQKLNRMNKEVSLDSISKELYDVAGIRVICSFNSDMYSLIEVLINQDDIELIQIKDYVKNPKENGYRSIHLLLGIPIFLSNEKRIVKVEVQFRTIAMDFWASLEHDIRYKKRIESSEHIANELRKCADSISEIDKKMQEIRIMLEESSQS